MADPKFPVGGHRLVGRMLAPDATTSLKSVCQNERIVPETPLHGSSNAQVLMDIFLILQEHEMFFQIQSILHN